MDYLSHVYDNFLKMRTKPHRIRPTSHLYEIPPNGTMGSRGSIDNRVTRHSTMDKWIQRSEMPYVQKSDRLEYMIDSNSNYYSSDYLSNNV